MGLVIPVFMRLKHVLVNYKSRHKIVLQDLQCKVSVYLNFLCIDFDGGLICRSDGAGDVHVSQALSGQQEEQPVPDGGR